MNADDAIDYIYNYASNGGVTYSDYTEARDYLRSLEKQAPQWLRHEGGEMPEGVDRADLVFFVYANHCNGDRAGMANWEHPCWYMVIPAPPEPPKKADKWRVTTGRTGSVLHKNDKHLCWLSCFTPAEQTAIVDALNKQAQGGGE